MWAICLRSTFNRQGWAFSPSLLSILHVRMPAREFQRCHGTLSWWMVIFIGLLMLNEPCSSCLNWMLFMLSCSTIPPIPQVPSSPPSPHPSVPSVVCEVGHWRLMNKGTLTLLMRPRGHTNKQWRAQKRTPTQHTSKRGGGQGRGKGQPSHFLQLKNADFLFVVLVAFFSEENYQQVHGGEPVLKMPSFLRPSPH